MEKRKGSVQRHLSVTARSQLVWEDLNAYVEVKGNAKQTLFNFTGSVKSGELVAILGPSGAGKSTFLNCLARKLPLYTGNVNFYSSDGKGSFAYVPQTDYVCPFLTIKESLALASKLKNKDFTSEDHDDMVEEVIDKFDLQRCRNNFAKKCSGGEVKRLSIALEIICNPTVLIIDEPTSGLDSATAFKVVQIFKNQVLQSKTLKQPAALVTIHQPSSDLFNLFDRVYLLANGICMYGGTPQEVVPHFAKFNHVCPVYYNPADFILHIAGESVGQPIVQALNEDYYASEKKTLSVLPGMTNVNDKVFQEQKSYFSSYWLLVGKQFKSYWRDPLQMIFRLFLFMVFPFSPLFIIPAKPDDNFCTFLPYNSTHMVPETPYEREDRIIFGIQKSFLLYYNMLLVFLSAIFHDNLIFSLQVNIFLKEHRNKWYSTIIFFLAFFTVTAFVGFLYAAINATTFYFIAGTPFDPLKLMYFIFLITLDLLIGDAIGLIISVVNPGKELVNIVVGTFLGLAIQPFSGFVIRIRNMNFLASVISFMMPFRYFFELGFKLFYKNDVCIVDNQKIFNFDQLLDFVDFFNFETSNSLQIIELIPLKVKHSLEQFPWTRPDINEMAIASNGLEDEDPRVALLESFWIDKADYIINAFDIPPRENWIDFAAISGFLLLFLTICVILLRHKTKAKL